MDDSIKRNLVAQNHQVSDLEGEEARLTSRATTAGMGLLELKAQADALRMRLGLQPRASGRSDELAEPQEETSAEPPLISNGYAEITANNSAYLEDRGLVGETLEDQFTQEQLDAIARELCAPVPRIAWDRWDCCAVLAAGVAGVTADFFTSANDQRLKEWLAGYEIESPSVSIDYQGPGFHGGYHRGMSPGHDVLRVFEAIWQIKNGTFRGLKQVPGGFTWVETALNQYGTPYESFEMLEALIVWMRHLFSDFVTPYSLPFPGMSFLWDIPDHDIRKFAIQLYRNGLNLRFILTQALAPALVELVVRAYFLGREYRESGAIKLDNAKSAKQTELLLAGHAMVVAVNAGRIVVKCNAEGPLALRDLNVPAIMAAVNHLVPFVAARLRAHDPLEILKRNARVIVEGYDAALSDLRCELEHDAEFCRFLSSGDVIRV